MGMDRKRIVSRFLLTAIMKTTPNHALFGTNEDASS
jgi:hypothetical protein